MSGHRAAALITACLFPVQTQNAKIAPANRTGSAREDNEAVQDAANSTSGEEARPDSQVEVYQSHQETPPPVALSRLPTFEAFDEKTVKLGTQNTCLSLAMTKEKEKKQMEVRKAYLRGAEALRDSQDLYISIVNEVRSRPWVTLFGELPASKFAVFAKEMQQHGDYSQHYLRTLWRQLPPIQRKPYVLVYASAQKKKLYSSRLVRGSRITAKALFLRSGIVHVSQQPEFKRTGLKVRIMMLQQAWSYGEVPRKVVEHFETLAKSHRELITRNIHELVRIRIGQVLEIRKQEEMASERECDRKELS